MSNSFSGQVWQLVFEPTSLLSVVVGGFYAGMMVVCMCRPLVEEPASLTRRQKVLGWLAVGVGVMLGVVGIGAFQHFDHGQKLKQVHQVWKSQFAHHDADGTPALYEEVNFSASVIGDFGHPHHSYRRLKVRDDHGREIELPVSHGEAKSVRRGDRVMVTVRADPKRIQACGKLQPLVVRKV